MKQEEKKEEEIKEREPIEWGNIKVEIKDSQKKEKFECAECNKKLKRNDHLKRHMLKHTTDGEHRIRLPCTDCDRTFSLAFKLAIHIKETHQAFNEVPAHFDDDGIDSEKLYTCVHFPKT